MEISLLVFLTLNSYTKGEYLTGSWYASSQAGDIQRNFNSGRRKGHYRPAFALESDVYTLTNKHCTPHLSDYN